MKNTNKICKNLKRYIDIQEPEVQITVFLTTVLIAVLSYIKAFENFIAIQGVIQGVITAFIGGFIGLLGIVLAGVAIIIGLFSRKDINFIEKVNGVDLLSIVLDSFKFCAISLGIEIIYLSVINIVIAVPEPLIPKCWFYIFLIITLYGVIFNLFYVISLMNESIDLYKVKQEYSEASNLKKSIFEKANEQRIDFILSKMINKQSINPDTFTKELLDSVDNSNLDNKDKIKDYLKEYYS